MIAEIKEFYNNLLKITTQEIFKNGKWELLSPLKAWESNITFKNILAWGWTLKAEKRIVVVNYSDKISTCRLKLDLRDFKKSL